MMRSLILTSALLLAGCGSSNPANVAGLSDVLADVLPGAQGKTLADQDQIDITVARACAAGVYSAAACARHTDASAARRRALTSDPTS